MKVIWLFRTNLRQYEYYHNIDNLEQFKKECHDFYLLMGIWMLENTELEEFYVFRLTPEKLKDNQIISHLKEFNINGKKFKQIFVNRFQDAFVYKSPDITLFRGGFPEYGKLTKAHSRHFGLKLYLGAGQRVFPKYGGIYDKILIEDERDQRPSFDCIPFYKTANPNIFYPMNLEKKWDICWPCNFSQIKYKGQEWFIKQIARSDYLKFLKIVHLGNKPEEGIKLCQKHDVYNIEFKGWVSRPQLNEYFNKSKMGFVTSNEKDGSPRIITEMLCSSIPTLIRKKCRIVSDYYNSAHVDEAMSIIYKKYKIEDLMKNNIRNPHSELSTENVCQKNMELWKQ